jgi:hypothetical protein
MKVTQYLLLLLFINGVSAAFSAEPGREYKIKAGFLYKFLLFAEWPESAFKQSENTIIVGILGENPFEDLFDLVQGTPVNGRKLEIIHFHRDTEVEVLKYCHLLFIDASLENDYVRILDGLRGYPVLTVGEIIGFGAAGGMINFVMEENNVAFEINKSAAEHAGITLRSKLLRVAVRIIDDHERGPK